MRIGLASRHGTALLARQQAAKKLLLLIGDGKPTDYARYEGHYGRPMSIRQYAKHTRHAFTCMR
jgi:nitric oxide reductase activation protein